jgi:hypothetical protein
MMAISIKQPMAWLLVEGRAKDLRVINLDADPKLHPGQNVLIHAGEYDDRLNEVLRDKYKLHTPQPNKWSKGPPVKTNGIIGVIEVVSCGQKQCTSRYANPRKWNLVFKNPYPYQFEPYTAPVTGAPFEYLPK